MPLKEIRFGTSGWRGIIADDFTVEGVRAACAAIADHVHKKNPRKPSLIVGYDTRFLSEEFARQAAQVLTARGIHCYLTRHATPTPAIACEILRRRTDGGINITASHNPPEYNGLKFSTPDGAPALPEITHAIEELTRQYLQKGVHSEGKAAAARCEEIDPRADYLETLAEKVDAHVLRRARLKTVFDPLYGAGAGHLDGFLSQHGLEVRTLHGQRDVLFGGHPPEPSDEILQELRQTVRSEKAHLGLSTDGDADRFGIVDRDGTFVSANHILALLLDYLLETRLNWPRAVARSVATTHLVDAVARHHDVAVHETPVGFKYIGELIKQDKIILGGEESAGLSIFGHVPEKDGILAGLLVAEMVARRGASLQEQLRALFGKVGAYYPVRVNLHLPAETRERFAARIQKDPKSLDDRKVARTDRTDGLKLLLENDAWVLFRLSGTEPVVRCYCESHTEKETQALVELAKRFVLD